ncbi:hypothetical protein A4X13_0g8208 [Tilletia indica]|uniref:Uncharacterized protein n=1 Tax=Tilletia indica TaxID=43049 RepID=A0A8T8SFS1_9BASI|nr:hypothetical protein A4X13_0g8208 [Tilletia indica]
MSAIFRQPLPTYDSAQERDVRWFGFDRLLGVLQAHRTTQPLPLIDVTIGLTGISAFKATMRRFPNFLQRIAAFRVISDLEEEPNRNRDPDRMQQFSQLATTRWRQLGLLVVDMFNTEGQPPALRLFHAENATYQNVSNRYIDRETWDCFKAVLPAKVEDLALRLDKDEADPNRTCTLLEADWIQLQSFRLVATGLGGPDLNRIQESVNHFLARHQQLEDICITGYVDVGSIPIPQTFPNLKRCAITKSKYANLAPFLARHYNTVIDLLVPTHQAQEQGPTLFPPGISPNLDSDSMALKVLRTSADVAGSFVMNGARPRHLEIRDVRYLKEFKFREWLFGVNEAAEAVTCLDLRVQTKPYEDAEGQALLEAKFMRGALPNLVELALTWAIPKYSTALQDAPEDVRGLGCRILENLKHQTSLRALRLEHPHAAVLPPDTLIELKSDDALPPRLEYFTWHATHVNVSQYFRIGRISTVQPEILSDGSYGRGSIGSVRKVRLERLPDMFRSWIDDSGVWHQTWRPRARNTLFDHSHSPPRLHS